MRVVAIVASLLLGMLVGGLVMLSTQDRSPGRDAPTPSTTTTGLATTVPPVSTTRVSGAPTTIPAPPPPFSDQVLLLWTPGHLPSGFADGVARLEGVTAVATVRSGLLHLTQSSSPAQKAVYSAPDGFVIPMEAVAFDPVTYTGIVSGPDADALGDLGAGQAVLGSTSARLRNLGPGADLVLDDGSHLTVTAVVDDVVIGAGEVAIPLEAAEPLEVDTERYLLIRYSGSRKDLEDAVRELLPEGLGVRIRGPGETPVLRHGDAVLAQVLIKDIFGEFAYRSDGGLSFVVDPGWREANIVTAEVPLIGSVTCHRNLLAALQGAMEELERRNLGSLVQESQGCFNPRFIAGKRGISRHAWGAAIDINLGANPEGLESIQDPRLVEVMERWGFTSGHAWLIPDPGHFEYVSPPG